MTQLQSILRKPISWLLFVALAAGILLFRDYGLSWDEPLFYKYAEALGYAYTPANWVSKQFDLNLSYGPSGDDHKNRGPGYLLLAHQPVHLLELLGIDSPSAWHLINFITFLLGVFIVYRLGTMLVTDRAALLGAMFFLLQPLLWGHAFINPKDMPFLVFFAGAIWLGFRLVDRLANHNCKSVAEIVLPALFLGIASSNRVLGPLAGLIVLTYAITQRLSRHAFLQMLAYVLVAVLIMFGTWPYLWENPLHLLSVFRFMSDNPTNLQVLFADQVYRAGELPRRYLPFYMLTTLTEPTWPLFILGLGAGIRKLGTGHKQAAKISLLLTWQAIPVLYAVAMRPAMYDGMRHFLFAMPPVFIIGSIGIEFILVHLNQMLLRRLALALILFPGIMGIATLHPYEYTYFNSFVGGTRAVFRHYETDYWLTCYKESVERFNQTILTQSNLYVHREAAVAEPYASPNVSILDEKGSVKSIKTGDFILVNTRTNEDRRTFPTAPELLTVGRAGALFCVIKEVP